MSDYILIEFENKYKENNDEYYICDLYLNRKNFKIIRTSKEYRTVNQHQNTNSYLDYHYKYSLLIDEGEYKYMLIDPKTNNILFYDSKNEIYSIFFERINYVKEIFLIKKLEDYKKTKVVVKRIINRLTEYIYKNLSFKKKIEYLTKYPNANIENLKGIEHYFDINIKITSQFDNTNLLVNCDHKIIGSDLEVYNIEYSQYICNLISFNNGYIEMIYYDSDPTHDLGSSHHIISSKIVINNESFDGFFKLGKDDTHSCALDYNYIYHFLRRNPNAILEFQIGLNMPIINYDSDSDYYNEY